MFLTTFAHSLKIVSETKNNSYKHKTPWQDFSTAPYISLCIHFAIQTLSTLAVLEEG